MEEKHMAAFGTGIGQSMDDSVVDTYRFKPLI